MGGQSGEHSISLRSAATVRDALVGAGHDVVPIGITRAGAWQVRNFDALLDQARSDLVEIEPVPGAAVTLARAARGPAGESRTEIVALEGDHAGGPGTPIDVVFPLVHGTGGEDGTLQGLLELLDVPFVGAGCLASAMAMDKIASKTLCAGAGIAQAEFLVAGGRDANELAGAIDAAFGFPCFVKPSALGSSVGISRVASRDELAAALVEARRWDRRVIVEQAVDVREIEVAMLGNAEPEISPPGEIIVSGGFYDFDSKYVDDDAELVAGAEVPEAQLADIRDIALEFWRLIGCRGMARADFFIERTSGRVLLNEINTIPGFTAISMYPRLWAVAGIDLPRLVDRLVGLALAEDA